jgi:proteasome assembly chaperone (PAC2) family protein
MSDATKNSCNLVASNTLYLYWTSCNEHDFLIICSKSQTQKIWTHWKTKNKIAQFNDKINTKRKHINFVTIVNMNVMMMF